MKEFYPTVSFRELGRYASGIPRMLLPVSSWAGEQLRRQEKRALSSTQVIGDILTPKLPASVIEVAADCGGFVATLKWGSYRYTPEQYVKWLHSLVPTLSWAAMMDYCCENEITSGQPGIVRLRQNATTDMAYHFWQNYRDVPWTWVPTIQGWEVADYECHARKMKPLIDEMQGYYGRESAFRVGIGTLCRRASAEMIRSVVQAVSEELGDVPLHLWGVKLGIFQSALALPSQVTSTDSAAFWFNHKDGWAAAHAEMKAWAKTHGKTHRHYMYEVAIPRYQQKIDTALAQIKQATMF